MKRKASKARKAAKAVPRGVRKAVPFALKAKPFAPKAKPLPAKAKAVRTKAQPVREKTKPAAAKAQPVPAPPPMDPKALRDAFCERFGPLFRQLRKGLGFSQEDLEQSGLPRRTLGGMEKAAAGTGLVTLMHGAQAVHIHLGLIALLFEAVAQDAAATPFPEPIGPDEFRAMIIRILRDIVRALVAGAPLDAPLSSFRAKDETGPGGLPPGGMPPET